MLLYLARRELEMPHALTKEWLHTNGIGGYASSTVADVHTRRYHGWLLAAVEPPSTRVLCFSRLMERATVGGHSVEFSSAEYPGVFHPRGFEYMLAFWDEPVPSFVYLVNGLRLLRQVYLLRLKNVCIVVYTLLDTGKEVDLELRPLFNWRHYHHLTHHPDSRWSHSVEERSLVVEPPGGDQIVMAFSGGSFSSQPVWYHRALYREELNRGLDYLEDHFSPGVLCAQLGGPREDQLIIGIGTGDDMKAVDVTTLDLPSRYPSVVHYGLRHALERAAETFIVQRDKGKSVIAGYHWFGDWGRDTMISIPGLTLVTARYEDALSILHTWAETRREGLIPNRFGDSDSAPEWNSVDAPLWFVYAVWKYWSYTQDMAAVRDLLGILEDILENYIKGTLFGIVQDRSGLVRAGQRGMQLTWMDAKVNGEVVTQRAGYAVDVNALWYNALLSMADMLNADGSRAKAAYYTQMARETQAAFNRVFWNGQYLDDAVHGGGELRPNQLLAVSLPFSPLPAERQRKVMAAVRNSLYTPYGLRTLCPTHPSYRGRYRGGVEERDRAYHQGTAWPWLTGQYVTAMARIGTPREDLWHLVLPFEAHLREAGIGSISEIFDGDSPHEPRGCISQAWSVAEVLRAIKEDIMGQDTRSTTHF